MRPRVRVFIFEVYSVFMEWGPLLVRWVSQNFDSWLWIIKRILERKERKKHKRVLGLFLNLIKSCIYCIFDLWDDNFFNLDF